MLFKRVKLEEGVLVQYLAFYTLNWKWEFGEPEVGFVEAGDETELLAALEEVDDIVKICALFIDLQESIAIPLLTSHQRTEDRRLVEAARKFIQAIQLAKEQGDDDADD